MRGWLDRRCPHRVGATTFPVIAGPHISSNNPASALALNGTSELMIEHTYIFFISKNVKTDLERIWSVRLDCNVIDIVVTAA
jgi:hypothetical protein